MPQLYQPILTLIEKAAQEGLRDVAKATLKRARELSPTDSGDSDKSGFVVVDDLTAQVGFKSFVSRRQHEDLDYQHEDGEQAKFLETASLEVDVGGIMAARMKRDLHG